MRAPAGRMPLVTRCTGLTAYMACFVGADVMESHVMLARRLKQVERTLHIRCDEGFRIGDGIVVVRFGREMHDRVMPRHDTFQ